MNWSTQDTSVILIGLAIVFLGLVCIVFLCKIMSALCNMSIKSKADIRTPVQTPNSQSTQSDEVIPNRAELIAAVSAAIAEEIGEDVSSIRILSVKKI